MNFSSIRMTFDRPYHLCRFLSMMVSILCPGGTAAGLSPAGKIVVPHIGIEPVCSGPKTIRHQMGPQVASQHHAPEQVVHCNDLLEMKLKDGQLTCFFVSCNFVSRKENHLQTNMQQESHQVYKVRY